MEPESRHLSTWIRRPAAEVYAYAADPAHLPEWAPGLGNAVENVDGQWFVETPMGRVAFGFVPHNDYGVLDHEVRLPSGQTFYNPLRVIPGNETCEVVFSLRRSAGMTDEEFDRDAAAVTADLTRLKQIIESRN
jgi:hypothetical protein